MMMTMMMMMMMMLIDCSCGIIAQQKCVKVLSQLGSFSEVSTKTYIQNVTSCKQNRTLLKEVINDLVLPVGSLQVHTEWEARKSHDMENLFLNEYTEAVLLVIFTLPIKSHY